MARAAGQLHALKVRNPSAPAGLALLVAATMAAGPGPLLPLAPLGIAGLATVALVVDLLRGP